MKPRRSALPVIVGILAIGYLAGCTTIPPLGDRYRLDLRAVPIPVMLNSGSNEPAGRILHASVESSVSSFTTSGYYYSTTTTTTRESLYSASEQILASILKSDSYVRLNLVEYSYFSSMIMGFTSTRQTITMNAEAAAQTGGKR